MTDTIEYRTEDKSAWPPGPWQAEPDKKQWTDKTTGLPCLIVRNHGGALCGYVGVADGHPLHGKEYGACVWPEKHDAHEPGDSDWHYNCTPQALLEAHGGITFASGCYETTPEVWRKAQKRYEAAAAEAVRYPVGDASKMRRNLAPVIGDYAAWAEHMRQRTVCHIPAPGGPDHVWWFGFDCSHCNDMAPGYDSGRSRGIYRTLAYVEQQCASLAAQLARISA